jgi:GT2 family glycosyltransferase
MPCPFVSVVVPTHNRPDMLCEALATVRVQTFTDYEIIVISNGESATARDASCAAARAFDARYVTLDRGNTSIARNVGIQRARGPWIALLDDDDLWLPTKLQRQVAEAERTGADLIACDYVQFYLDGSEIVRCARLIEGWTYPKAISHGYWWGLPSSVMVRKSVMEKLGGFDPRQRLGEDLDMWRRLSWHHKIHQIEEILVRYRSGHPSMMTQERTRYLYDLRLYLKMWLDSPGDLHHTIPAFSWYGPPRLVGILAPNWLLGCGRKVCGPSACSRRAPPPGTGLSLNDVTRMVKERCSIVDIVEHLEKRSKAESMAESMAESKAKALISDPFRHAHRSDHGEIGKTSGAPKGGEAPIWSRQPHRPRSMLKASPAAIRPAGWSSPTLSIPISRNSIVFRRWSCAENCATRLSAAVRSRRSPRPAQEP